MMKFLAVLSHLLRTLLALVVVGLLGAGGWYGYQTYNANELALRAKDKELAQRQAEIETLTADLVVKQEQIDRLEMAMQLLKVDHRVAQIVVVDQSESEDEGVEQTRFRFVEVNEEGRPLDEPREFTIEGDLLYVDAWVIKYLDEHVEESDPLRSTSVCLFRRLFGEHQKPSEGFELDAVGMRPTAYAQGSEMSSLEREIWSNFWDYANDPERAREVGVRAAHGEAPSIQLRERKLYRISLRASGGLTVVAEDLPAATLQTF